MRGFTVLFALVVPIVVAMSPTSADAQKSKTYNADHPLTVPQAAPSDAKEMTFVDKRYHVRFRVPPGWELSRKDGQVSTFHLDARSAPATAKLRGVAELDFNPFPRSTLAGALFYFSVEPHTTDAECAAQATAPSPAAQEEIATEHATGPATGDGIRERSAAPPQKDGSRKDVLDIAGMPFAHGHDEHGDICVEARDEVYTAWRRHACYRFDMAINTFCPEASGAQPITDQQIHDVNERMTGILSSVELGWEKGSSHAVPVPEQPATDPKPAPMIHHPLQGSL